MIIITSTIMSLPLLRLSQRPCTPNSKKCPKLTCQFEASSSSSSSKKIIQQKPSNSTLLITFYLKYPALPSLTTPHMQLFHKSPVICYSSVQMKHPNLPDVYQILLRLSNLISIIPFYPAIFILPYPTYSIQLIPLYPTIPKKYKREQKKNTIINYIDSMY